MKKAVFAFVCAFALNVFAQESVTLSANEADFEKWSARTDDVRFLPKAGPDGKPAIEIKSDKNLTISCFVPADSYRGKWLVFSAKVKAVDVAKPKQHYEGVKMIVGTGSLSEGSVTRSGSYDWKENATAAFVPENAKRIQIIIGLMNTTGTVLYSDLKLTAYPPSADGNFLPTGKVLEKKMANRSGAYLAKGGEQGAEAVQLSSDQPKWNEVLFAIPADKVRGHKVEFSARMKGEKIDFHHYWGASFKIVCRRPNAKPQIYEAKYPHKSDFDWIDMRQDVMIPSDAVSVQAVIALYKVKGKVTFSELTFKLDD